MKSHTTPGLTALGLALVLVGAPAARGQEPAAESAPPDVESAIEEEAPPPPAALPDLPDLDALDAVPEEADPGEAVDADGGFTAWEIVQFGGVVGYIIILLSFVALALVIEYAITIRRARLMPAALVEETKQLLADGRTEDAEARVANDSSFVGYVVARGLRERSRGYEAMVKAMEDAADEATGTRLRRVEHLNIIGNISPMLGLLGTVLGMTNTFNQISQSVGGVDPRLLAGGIFQALITTVMGLIVGIPALYFYSLFRHRVDALISEATLAAEHMTEVFKEPGAPERRTGVASDA